MTLFSRANKDYKCDECALWIRKGHLYINKPRYKFGADKYCIDCIERELKIADK